MILNNYHRFLSARKALNFAVVAIFFIAAPILFILA